VPKNPRIRFHQGEVHVDGWPADLPAPHGVRATGDRLVGPARLRWRLRAALADADVGYRDETCAVSIPAHIAHHDAAAPPPPGLATTLRGCGHRGVLIDHDERTHLAIARLLTELTQAPPLLLVPDTAAAHRVRSQLAAHTPANVQSIHRAAADMHWLGRRHDALLVDAPERMPSTLLDRALDQCAALARVGFASRVPPRDAERWCARLGPVVAVLASPSAPRCEQLHVPMPADAARQYEAAWSTFFAAFDRFVAARGEAGFGTFLAQARGDPLQRPALHAWHEAVRCAAWHEHKASLVDELLRHHAGRRVLLFTPDRACAYELSRAHLIPAITAELPRAERAAMLDAFADGTIRALAGPRLLDGGVAQHTADVGVLIGGGFGAAQRAARCQRVRPDGVVYELVSQDTLEVGRAHRWRPAAADAAAVVHER